MTARMNAAGRVPVTTFADDQLANNDKFAEE